MAFDPGRNQPIKYKKNCSPKGIATWFWNKLWISLILTQRAVYKHCLAVCPCRENPHLSSSQCPGSIACLISALLAQWKQKKKQHSDREATVRCGEKPNVLPVNGSVGLLVWRVTRGYTPAGFCVGSRPSAKELASSPVHSQSCLKHNRRTRSHWAELNRM